MASAVEDVAAPGAAKADDASAADAEKALKIPSSEKGDELAVGGVKDEQASKDLNPDEVRAPGLMQRTREEVEAVAEALQEKLDLKGDAPEAAKDDNMESKESKESKEHKEEQPGVFKRLLKKMGWKA